MKRVRKLGDSTRQVDEETRRLVAADRLAQLMRDQAATAIETVGIDEDLWELSENSDAEGKPKQKRKSTSSGSKARLSNLPKGDTLFTQGTRRARRTIEMVLMDEPLTSSDKDTFLTIEAPPASKLPGLRPAYKLCSVCAYPSPYKCLRCGSNFCSLQCNSIHRDTKCLKFAD
jgi:zinc finger HIT domain-containing protein 1